MYDALVKFIMFCLAYFGWASIAVSQKKHAAHVCKALILTHKSVLILRIGGYILLAACCVLALATDGAGFGSVLWTSIICTSAIAVSFTLAYQPHWLGFVLTTIRSMTIKGSVANNENP